MRRSTLGTLLVAAAPLAAAWGCGPATVRPVSFPDPEVSCPGARLSWNLEIRDERVAHEAEARMEGSIRDAIQKSFPGCHWGAADPDAGTIGIEVHRFVSRFDQGSWEAAVEWTVTARDAGGHVLTQFEVNEEVSRPNYQGSDNERESLTEAFRRGIERTAKGLSAVTISGLRRPPEGTLSQGEVSGSDGGEVRSTLLLPTASRLPAARSRFAG